MTESKKTTGTMKDVTSEFAELCSLLGQGEMVQTPSFDLSKAISAVEFLQPKMDAGMIGKRPQPDDLNLRYNFTDQELLALCDQLWMMELAHYDGAFLLQSVLTCLYAHPNQVRKAKEENFLLYVILVCTLRSCARSQQLVQTSMVSFEEDYHTGSLGVELVGENLSDDECNELLIEAAARTDNEQLRSRFLFRSFLLEASRAMDKYSFQAAESFLLQASNEFPRTKIGSAPSSSVDFAFDPQVNFWRIAPQPPRPTIIFDAKTVIERFQAMIEGLFFVCNVRHCVSQGNARGELLSLYQEMLLFSRSKRKLNALIRSRMLLALCDEQSRAFGTASWKSMVSKDVSLFGAEATSAYMEDEMIATQACHYMFETFRTLCFNPARQRRKLVHRLEDWGSFQQKCESLDARQLNIKEYALWPVEMKHKARQDFTFNLGTWASIWCLRQMIRFLELGGELSLYRSREGRSFAFYLYSLYRLEGALLAASLKKRNIKAEPETSSKNPYGYVLQMQAEISDLKKLHLMCCVQFYVVLLKYDRTKEKDGQVVFDSPKMLFEHRFFDPFSTIWLPIIVSSAEVEAAYSPEHIQTRPFNHIVETLSDNLNRIKTYGQEFTKKVEANKIMKRYEEEVKSIVKTSIRMSLALSVVLRAIKEKSLVVYETKFDENLDASLMSVEVKTESPPQ